VCVCVFEAVLWVLFGKGGGCSRARVRLCPDPNQTPTRPAPSAHAHAAPHLHVRQTELAPLRHQLPIHRHARAAVVVQASPVAPLLVGIQVDAARLCSCRPDQIQSCIQLAQLVVAAAAVRNDFHPGQRERNVRRLRREQLLAGLRRQQCVGGAQGAVAKGAGGLTGQCADVGGEGVVLQGASVLPGAEVPVGGAFWVWFGLVCGIWVWFSRGG